MKEIIAEYDRIIKQEENLQQHRYGFQFSSQEIFWAAQQIHEHARLSLVPRAYIQTYGLADLQPLDLSNLPTLHGGLPPTTLTQIVHESVGAHTNLMIAMVTSALRLIYGLDFGNPSSKYPRTFDGFSYGEIIEAIQLHDLPENISGDTLDNSSRDETAKLKRESAYYRDFCGKYPLDPIGENRFATQVSRLLELFENHESHTGRLLKCADKAAAVIIALCYDSLGLPPLRSETDPTNSSRDRSEMALCDDRSGGFCHASEMWTADFFHFRQFTTLDDSGFFTALIVAYTLMVRGHWYTWRERDYHSPS